MEDELQAEHDTIYGSGRLPPFEADWVTGRVLAGRNCLSALDVRRLVLDDRITHELDVRERREWCPPLFGGAAVEAVHTSGIVRKHVPIPDGGTPTFGNLDAAVAFLSTALSDPAARVFVHCRAGQERTAAVLVAWYARERNVDVQTALRSLRQHRPSLRLLPNQETAVRMWLDARCSNGGSRINAKGPASYP